MDRSQQPNDDDELVDQVGPKLFDGTPNPTEEQIMIAEWLGVVAPILDDSLTKIADGTSYPWVLTVMTPGRTQFIGNRLDPVLWKMVQATLDRWQENEGGNGSPVLNPDEHLKAGSAWLRQFGPALDDSLKGLLGRPQHFMLLVDTPGRTQYFSNCSREDALRILPETIEGLKLWIEREADEDG